MSSRSSSSRSRNSFAPNSSAAWRDAGVGGRACPRGSPVDGLAVDFVVESVPSQLVEIVDRVRDGRLSTHIGTVAALDDAVPALNPTERRKGKTVIRVCP